MKTLEEFKIFKYVAWVTVIAFAGFTAFLAMRLTDVADTLIASAGG